MRFLSAQLDAYLADDLWLANARHANAMAQRLADGIGRNRLVHPVEANELFVELPEPAIRGLLADGFEFYRWGGADARQIRLVTAFDTRPEDVDAFVASCRRLVN
jgi:threonine aldolase